MREVHKLFMREVNFWRVVIIGNDAIANYSLKQKSYKGEDGNNTISHSENVRGFNG